MTTTVLMQRDLFGEKISQNNQTSLNEQKIVNVCFHTFMQNVTEQGIVKVLKGLGAYKTTGKGENRRVSCNPYIWVLVAMELNPMLYAKVVTWLTDKLIANRIDACDLNKDLMDSMSKHIENPSYSEVNKALNMKIFGHHETGMRNLASEEDLKKLNKLQTFVAECIERGYIKNNAEILKEINR